MPQFLNNFCTTCKTWKQHKFAMKWIADLSVVFQIGFLSCLMISSMLEGIYSNRCIPYGKTDTHGDCPETYLFL